MRVRFQADNDLDRAIVRGVVRQRPAIDFHSQPLNFLDDVAVLNLAAREGRLLVSHDVNNMPVAFAQVRRNGFSPGLLLVPQSCPVGQSIENQVLIWDLTGISEWRNRICYLPTLSDFH